MRTTTLYEHMLAPGAGGRLPASADAVAFDSRNRLYVLDRASRLVFVFGRSGVLERRLELGAVVDAPLQMTVTSDDRLVVSDPGRQRFVAIDPDDPRRSAPHSFPDLLPTGPLSPHPDGGVVTRARRIPSTGPGFGTLPPAEVVWLPLDGRPAEPLHTLPSGGGGGADPLDPAALVAPLPGRGVVVAQPRSYRLILVQGGRTREVARNVRARSVGERDQRWAEQRRACSQNFTLGPGGRTAGNPMGGAPPPRAMPGQVPVLRRLSTTPSGRIWVERTPADLERPGRVDVFAADGSYAGSFDGIGAPHAWSADGRTAAFVAVDGECRSTVRVLEVSVEGAR